MKKKLSAVLSAIVFVIAVIIALFNGADGDIQKDVSENAQTKGQPFTVHMIDVGQGDSILIKSGDKVMLIDAGERGNGENVVSYLTEQGVTKIDYIVATHPHSDHIGSMPEVFGAFPVDNVIMPRLPRDLTPTTQTYKKFISAVKKSGAKVIAAKAGESFNLGDALMTVVGPVGTPDTLNNASVVIRADYKDSSFLFTGDAEQEAEERILESGADIDVDVLKMGHHGSSTSSSRPFFDEVSPSLCLISCGEDNKYGHPHRETLELLRETKVPYERTDLKGTVVVGTDGEELFMSFPDREN